MKTFKFLPSNYQEVEDMTGAKIYPNVIEAEDLEKAVKVLFGCDPMYMMSNGKGFNAGDFVYTEE